MDHKIKTYCQDTQISGCLTAIVTNAWAYFWHTKQHLNSSQQVAFHRVQTPWMISTTFPDIMLSYKLWLPNSYHARMIKFWIHHIHSNWCPTSLTTMSLTHNGSRISRLSTIMQPKFTKMIFKVVWSTTLSVLLLLILHQFNGLF